MPTRTTLIFSTATINYFARSPSAMSKLTSWMMVLSPNRFTKCCTLMPMHSAYSFSGARITAAISATVISVVTMDSALATPQLAFSKYAQIEIDSTCVLEV